MTTGWLRNYGAMGDEKLLRTLKQFESGYGEAVNRVNDKGGDMGENHTKASYEARKRGLIDSNYVAPDTEILTEAKFCPECERKRKFILDDYICKECRTLVDA
jgi:hypothetical protein